MSASNNRNKDYETYHHLMSRIAHQVFFMTDEVRNDFLEMIRRAADFCGIRLVAWCIMANHFHILAFLPAPEALGEEEILRRYGVLKGPIKLEVLRKELASMRLNKETGEAAAQERLKAISDSMYKVGVFMKILKQWLTQEYNSRYTHRGTLWEGVYKDVLVKNTPAELGKRAGYIHLNPVRAAICSGSDEYLWSSLNALKRGDELALDGMRRIYGAEASREEILESHRHLMAELLEKMKLERAEEIARKRAAGIEMPVDHLTSEALVAQAEANLARAAVSLVEEKTVEKAKGRPKVGGERLCETIRRLLAENPSMGSQAIVEATGKPRSTVFRYLKQVRAGLGADVTVS